MQAPGALALSKQARRVGAALTLGLGAWLVLHTVADVTPREVRVAVGLRAFRERETLDGDVRAVRVVLRSRAGEPARAVEARFDRRHPAPLSWEQTVSVAPGEYDAEVSVQTDRAVRTRSGRVRLEAGARVELATPRVE